MTAPLQLPEVMDDRDAPAVAGEAINVSSTDWTPTVSGATCTRWVVIGGAGVLTFDTPIQAGVALYFPIGVVKLAVTKVHMTGTSASNISALY